MMEPLTYVWIGLTVGIGSFIQGAVGFAFGIFSIPVLIWFGIEPQNAIAMILSLVTVQTALGCYQNRTEILWREVFTISGYRFVGILVGANLLALALTLPAYRIKQGVGAFLLIAVGLQAWYRPQRRAHVAHGWKALAGILSGILAGLVGMGGPPVVLWAMAHDWSTIRARTVLWAMFLLMAPCQLVVYLWKFDAVSIGHAITLGLVYAPVVMLMSHLGTRVGSYAPTELMRRIVYGILIAIGLSSVLARPTSSGHGRLEQDLRHGSGESSSLVR
jgi:uncharacterized membrane protein YfcA